MACQLVFRRETGVRVRFGVPESLPKPYIHCLLWAFTFFSTWQCQLTQFLAKNEAKTSVDNIFLFSKSARKWNPRFFDSNSANIIVVETDFTKNPSPVLVSEISISILEAEFKDQLRENFSKGSYPAIQLIWKKRMGFGKGFGRSDLLSFSFEEVEILKKESDDWNSLLESPWKTLSKGKIQDELYYRIYEDSSEAVLERESQMLDGIDYLEWNYDYGNFGITKPSTDYRKGKDGDRKLITTSQNYDISLLRLEKISLNPDLFFQKTICIHDGFEISYVPMLSLSPNANNTVPIASKRFGAFLLKGASP